MKADTHIATLDIDELLALPAGITLGGINVAQGDAGDGPFRLRYQPVIDLPSGGLVALKALPQWEHPTLGTLSPRRFLPLIMAAGRAGDFGLAILRRACLDSSRWIAAGHEGIRIDIDLIQSQFYDAQLPRTIEAVLAISRMPAALICLQISEAILRQNPVDNLERLAQLKTCGVGLALSNFGGGAFAVSAMQAFSFTRINIGPAFVQDIVAVADDAAMAQEIFDSAHRFGMRIGADGIETAIEYELLREYACDEAQGPYLLRALSAHDVEVLLPQRASFSEVALLPHKPRRALLLVDDEPNILNALKRVLRPDNYDISLANSGAEGLALLEKRRFDVIVCDQRMPGMSGVEFFGIAKQRFPDTVRIILSGYTELQSVIDAVNQGAIYKFLCKPWDDQQLRGHVAEAFERKELADENQRLNLEVHTVNQRLALANRKMQLMLKQQQQQIQFDEVSLDIVREALHHVPLPVIGQDDCGMVVFANLAARALFKNHAQILGCDAEQLMPELAAVKPGSADGSRVIFNGVSFIVHTHLMGSGSESRGNLLIFTDEASL